MSACVSMSDKHLAKTYSSLVVCDKWINIGGREIDRKSVKLAKS
jgi:hypothetical protein